MFNIPEFLYKYHVSRKLFQQISRVPYNVLPRYPVYLSCMEALKS